MRYFYENKECCFLLFLLSLKFFMQEAGKNRNLRNVRKSYILPPPQKKRVKVIVEGLFFTHSQHKESANKKLMSFKNGKKISKDKREERAGEGTHPCFMES